MGGARDNLQTRDGSVGLARDNPQTRNRHEALGSGLAHAPWLGRLREFVRSLRLTIFIDLSSCLT
jgi:hypothetical protein